MTISRATSRALPFVGLALVMSGASPARAECPPPIVFTASPHPQIFFVPEGCPFMRVKMWGNGGNTGLNTLPALKRGNGGGGAAIEAVYQVEADHRFRARVIPQYPNQTYPGPATALHDQPSDLPLLIAAGGGGGGSSRTGSSPDPHGGAGGGGASGQAGLPAFTVVPGQTVTVTLLPGEGGTQNQGGLGGTGIAGDHGQPGGEYPCGFSWPTPCGYGGGPAAGNGGLGYWGGGGGGGHSIYAGAGGGGGASFVAANQPTLPHILYSRRYAGDRDTPGNPDDPDRQGAGQGGISTGVGPAGIPGAFGRIVVRFNALEIIPEQTTRWKPMRDDNQPIMIAFDSPVQLPLAAGSAELEITDPNGVQVAVTPQPLEDISPGGGELYRYRLPWNGPWTRTVGGETNHLPAGNYRVTVRVGTPAGVVRSEPYDRVSLVEVVSVTMWTHPAGQPLSLNPAVPGISGQTPSQARLYEVPGQGAQPGRRIFAEAPSVGAAEVRKVSVRIETFPTITDLPASAPPIVVNVRSFDVDDPVTGPKTSRTWIWTTVRWMCGTTGGSPNAELSGATREYAPSRSHFLRASRVSRLRSRSRASRATTIALPPQPARTGSGACSDSSLAVTERSASPMAPRLSGRLSTATAEHVCPRC